MGVHLPHVATANTSQSYLSSPFQNSQQQPLSLISPSKIFSNLPLLFFSIEQEQPPTPSLNFVYRKNQQLDPNPFSRNIKSASSSISMISCVSPWCASDHQQFLFSSNQSTQISKREDQLIDRTFVHTTSPRVGLGLS
jgi:hypothetical protein